jgi:hypothetical protein
MAKKKIVLGAVTATEPEAMATLPASVLATRIFEEDLYDEAVLGTVPSPDGVPVLVYDWETLEDIRAGQIISQLKWKPDLEGNYDSKEGSPWDLAGQELSLEVQTYFLNRTGPIPAIVRPVLQDLEDYPEGSAFYEIRGATWVSEPSEH